MGFLRDLRFAARQLKASPGYTVAAVTTLALAIGASTAIFSAVYAVLLKPMPIRQPSQLAVAWGGSPALAMRVIELSYLDIRDMGEAAPRVGKVASVGSSAWNTVLDGEGEPVRLAAFGVSGSVLRGDGRGPAPGTDARAPGRHRQRATGRGAQPRHVAPAIRRRPQPSSAARSSLDDQMNEVVGVMPAGFDYPRGAQLWTTDRADPGRDSRRPPIPIRCATSACSSWWRASTLA